MVGLFVGLGVGYIIAEYVALFIAATAFGFAAVIIGAICTLVWVITHPITSVRGWVLFLAGSTTLILLPVMFMYAVVLGGHASEVHTTVAQDILSLVCAIWFLADIVGVGLLYVFCKEMDFSEDHTGWVLIGVVAAGVFLVVTFTKAESKKYSNTSANATKTQVKSSAAAVNGCGNQVFASHGFPATPLKASNADMSGTDVVPSDAVYIEAGSITEVDNLKQMLKKGYSVTVTDNYGLDDNVTVQHESDIGPPGGMDLIYTTPSDGNLAVSERYVNPAAGLAYSGIFAAAPQPGSWCITLTVGSGSQTVYKASTSLNVEDPN